MIITRAELWPGSRTDREVEGERWRYDLFLLRAEIEGRKITAADEGETGRASFTAGPAGERAGLHPTAADLGKIIRAAVENDLPLPGGLLLYVAGRLDGSIAPPAGRPVKPMGADVLTYLWPLWLVAERRGQYERDGARGALRRALEDVRADTPRLGLSADRLKSLWTKAQRLELAKLVLAIARTPAVLSRYNGGGVEGVTVAHALTEWLPLTPQLGFEPGDIRAILAAVLEADWKNRGRKTP